MKTTFKREAIIGNQGFVINGGKTGGGSGYSVSSAGDVNGNKIYTQYYSKIIKLS
jgi:hypothetical protein